MLFAAAHHIALPHQPCTQPAIAFSGLEFRRRQRTGRQARRRPGHPGQAGSAQSANQRRQRARGGQDRVAAAARRQLFIRWSSRGATGRQGAPARRRRRQRIGQRCQRQTAHAHQKPLEKSRPFQPIGAIPLLLPRPGTLNGESAPGTWRRGGRGTWPGPRRRFAGRAPPSPTPAEDPCRHSHTNIKK